MAYLPYGTSLFPPSGGASNPGLDARCHSLPAHEQGLQPPSPFNFGSGHTLQYHSLLYTPLGSTDLRANAQGSLGHPVGEGFTGGINNEFLQPTGHQQQYETSLVPSYTEWPNFQRWPTTNTASSLGEGTSQTDLFTWGNQQPTPRRPSTSHLRIFPPPEYFVPHAARHERQAMQAFTDNVAIQGFVKCILHSSFLHNQTPEPRILDFYGTFVLRQVAQLPGCPPIDFSNSRHSILIVLVGRSKRGPCCLICGKSRSSIPRVLGCVRRHLLFKPFRCEGCPACNPTTGYRSFGSDALLKEHLNGQTIAICAQCGSSLRQQGMRRHWDTQHEELPNTTPGHPRYPKHTSPLSHTTVSPENEDND